METTTRRRRRTTISLPEYMLTDLSNEARRRKTTISKLLEDFVEPALYQHPNPETLAAIEEARSGVEMEELTPYNIEHFEEWVASL
ncbi:MAG: toxin-antitoxin system protein [Bacteroidaceae bacterium]|nr:toxin-antitoxin system protein [Bacteroidaceae bacterium]